MTKHIKHAHMFRAFLTNLLVLLHLTQKKKNKLKGMQTLPLPSETKPSLLAVRQNAKLQKPVILRETANEKR